MDYKRLKEVVDRLSKDFEPYLRSYQIPESELPGLANYEKKDWDLLKEQIKEAIDLEVTDYDIYEGYLNLVFDSETRPKQISHKVKDTATISLYSIAFAGDVIQDPEDSEDTEESDIRIFIDGRFNYSSIEPAYSDYVSILEFLGLIEIE